MGRVRHSAFAVKVALLIVGIVAGGAAASVATVGFGNDMGEAERALTIEGETGAGALTVDRGRVAFGTDKAVRIWSPATGRVIRFAGGFVGPDADLALSTNLLAWTSTEEGIGCSDEAYLADLSSRRRVTVASGGRKCDLITVGGGDVILLKDGPLWRIARAPTDRATRRCPGGRVKRCIMVATGLWPIDLDGSRILAELRSKSRQLRLVGVAGHVVRVLPLTSNGDGALLRGRAVYVQRGRTLTRYDIPRRRVTGHWTVGRPEDVLTLADIRNGVAAYVVDAADETISVLRLRDGRQAPLPIRKSPDYEFAGAGAAAFDRGGLYYQFSEARETASGVVQRSIINFIPQKRIDALFGGG